MHASPSPHVRRKRQARRQEILAEALAVVAEGGAAALTMPAVAARLGCTVGALYRYFDNRDALEAALQLRVLDELRASVTAASGPDPLATVRATGRAYAAFAGRRPSAFGLLATSLADPRVQLPEPYARSVFAGIRDTLAVLAARIEAAQRAGALRDGDAEARALAAWAALHGAVQARKFARFDTARPDTLPAAVLDDLLRAWGASDPPPSIQQEPPP
ncbi:MAG: TetR/AcrR family transcriptional regulator [Alphaproteobacteria bacterium]|nr:TetR/AcrR family transcriptional regulator [Alphaproteobacteria bacterium]